MMDNIDAIEEAHPCIVWNLARTLKARRQNIARLPKKRKSDVVEENCHKIAKKEDTGTGDKQAYDTYKDRRRPTKCDVKQIKMMNALANSLSAKNNMGEAPHSKRCYMCKEIIPERTDCICGPCRVAIQEECFALKTGPKCHLKRKYGPKICPKSSPKTSRVH